MNISQLHIYRQFKTSVQSIKDVEKITVVLGAGASNGCGENTNTPRTDLTPPLTKELFSPRGIFREPLKDFEGAESLAIDIRDKIVQNISLETILRELKNSEDSNTQKWVKEIPLYLRAVFKKVSDGYMIDGTTRYFQLVNEIRKRGFNALYITTNYDTLLEEGIRRSHNGYRFRTFDDYMKDDKIKLLKIHGCITWGRQFLNGHDQPIRNTGQTGYHHFQQNLWKSSYDVLKAMEGKKLSEEPKTFYDNIITDKDKNLLYPALALPEGGKETPICPSEHLDQATEFLKDCTRFLFIGYRANDETVRNLFQSVKINSIEKLYVVLRNQSAESKNDIFGTIKENLEKTSSSFKNVKDYQPIKDTFARFLSSQKFISLLSA